MTLRETTLADTYTALRMLGYTYLGAIRALRALGSSFAEAKAVADASDKRALALDTGSN